MTMILVNVRWDKMVTPSGVFCIIVLASLASARFVPKCPLARTTNLHRNRSHLGLGGKQGGVGFFIFRQGHRASQASSHGRSRDRPIVVEQQPPLHGWGFGGPEPSQALGGHLHGTPLCSLRGVAWRLRAFRPIARTRGDFDLPQALLQCSSLCESHAQKHHVCINAYTARTPTPMPN